MDSSDRLVRLRIINTAIGLILQNDSGDITMQQLSQALKVDKGFVQRYFHSIDGVLNELVTDILQVTQDIMVSFIKDVMEPYVLEGAMKLHPDHILFQHDNIASQFGGRYVEHLAAALDYLVSHRSAFHIMARESLKDGKRKGCIMHYCNLFLPTLDNPAFEKTRLEGLAMHDICRFDCLSGNVFPIINYVLMYNDISETFALSDQAMRDRLLHQIRVSNQKRYNDLRFSYSDC